MFPSSGSLTQRPLRSPGSWWGQFPGFLATIGHCDFRPPYPARFVVLRTPVTDPRACVRSARPDAGRRPGALRGGSSTPLFPIRQRSDLPGSWRTLLCLCPALGPRQDQRTRPCGALTRPPTETRRRLPRKYDFRGSMTRPWHSLSTLRPRVASSDARLASRFWPALRGVIAYPQGSYERFL